MKPLRIDAARAAALVVECQNDLVDESCAAKEGVAGALARAVHERDMLARLRGLLDAVRAAGVPVLYATLENVAGMPKPDYLIYRQWSATPLLAAGTWGAEIHATIRPEPDDRIVARHQAIDPSYGSALWSILDELGRTTLLVMGVSTHFAVEGTVRAAANRALDVVVIEDCCASFPHAWHRFSVENILPLIATVTTSERLLAALPRAQAGCTEGAGVSALPPPERTAERRDRLVAPPTRKEPA